MKVFKYLYLFLSATLLISCQSDEDIAKEAYDEIISILNQGTVSSGYAKILTESASGYGLFEVPGKSTLVAKKQCVTVSYSFITGGYDFNKGDLKTSKATEEGVLNKYALKKSSSGVYLSANWQPKGSVGGVFSLKVDKGNSIRLYISCNGGRITYSSLITFQDKESAKRIAEILSNAYNRTNASKQNRKEEALKAQQEYDKQIQIVSAMLKAAGYDTNNNPEETIKKYSDSIKRAYTFGPEGERDLGVEEYDLEVYNAEMLKYINRVAKSQKQPDALPVFVFNNNVIVIPVYGDGLWGPIWGFIGLDGKTIVGAAFDHDCETEDIGAKIKTDPAFAEQFKGKVIFVAGAEKPFEVAKPGKHTLSSNNSVDAISGATMTSRGLNDAIVLWLNLYSGLFE